METSLWHKKYLCPPEKATEFILGLDGERFDIGYIDMYAEHLEITPEDSAAIAAGQALIVPVMGGEYFVVIALEGKLFTT